MNSAKVTAVTVTLLALVTVGVWQQRLTRRAMAEAAALREQVEQAGTLREENQRLLASLVAGEKRSNGQLSELRRLRGQSARMRQAEQENANLKRERDRLANQVGQCAASAATEPEGEKTPDQKLLEAKGGFARDIGLALRMAAVENRGRFPNEMPRTLLRLVEVMSGRGSEFRLQAKQFELVYHGPINGLKEPGRILLARETAPVQLSDGRWAKAYVTVDGGGSSFVADTPEQLATQEKALMPSSLLLE